MIVNNYSFYQNFRIRKIISTRYDLNSQIIVQQNNYEQLKPGINLINQSYTYDPKDYCSTNTNEEVNLPTEEELQLAEQYKNRIPQYKAEQINAGNVNGYTISYEQNYSNYDGYNAPPIAGQEQNNVGYVPPDFNQEQYQQKMKQDLNNQNNKLHQYEYNKPENPNKTNLNEIYQQNQQNITYQINNQINQNPQHIQLNPYNYEQNNKNEYINQGNCQAGQNIQGYQGGPGCQI